MKADLAIHGQVVDVSGQCMSMSLILGFKLDFSSGANWDDFCKSSHIIMLNRQENGLWQAIILSYASGVIRGIARGVMGGHLPLHHFTLPLHQN